ncbi:MAG: DUF4349 domain-containing protein [Defluviitaleaceae bacterium]|nr:DUF4349 domain-containing protein [Defluviitaleaceae bacterium]
MKKRIITSILASALFLAGCASNRSSFETSDVSPDRLQELSTLSNQRSTFGSSSSSSTSSSWDEAPAAISAPPPATSYSEPSLDFQMTTASSPTAGLTAVSTSANISAMIIKTGHMTIEFEYFDESVEQMRTFVSQFGGYIESQSQWQDRVRHNNEWANFKAGHATLRIPAANFETVRDLIQNLGEVSNYSDFAENITEQFYDAQATLDARIAERDRVMTFFDMANTIPQAIEIERRVAEINRDINTLEGRIRRMATDVAFSTLHISMSEMVETPERQEQTDPTFWQRIGNAFRGSANTTGSAFGNLFLVLAYLSVPLGIIAVIVIVIVVVYKKSKKKIKEKSEKSIE